LYTQKYRHIPGTDVAVEMFLEKSFADAMLADSCSINGKSFIMTGKNTIVIYSSCL